MRGDAIEQELVAATAVVLAIRRDSLFIALLGLVGGFATPFMLSSALDKPLSLFGYLVILNAGLAWVAYRRGWPLLTTLLPRLCSTPAWTIRWLARNFLLPELIQTQALPTRPVCRRRMSCAGLSFSFYWAVLP